MFPFSYIIVDDFYLSLSFLASFAISQALCRHFDEVFARCYCRFPNVPREMAVQELFKFGRTVACYGGPAFRLGSVKLASCCWQ